MALEDLAQNLRLLCSYGRSVSDICRRLDINRQQFNRYLAGKSKPSLHTVRRICDFFGIEDHEILLDHREFAELIRLRPPRVDQPRNPLHGFFEKLCQSPEQTLKEPGKYAGYYYFYFQPSRLEGTIYRNLIRFYQDGDLLLSKQLERYPDSEFNLPRVMKHEGVVYCMSDRLVLTEREEQGGSSLWHSIFYASDYNRITFLSGLSMGITPDSAHDVICYRSILEFLGSEIDVRNALKGCGGYPPASPEISDYVRHCVENDLPDNVPAMMPKY
ncbi:MAG: helix-turn-helix transcriptional regulator [Pseudomonadota bacterium]